MVALRRMRQEGCKLEVSFSYLVGLLSQEREKNQGRREEGRGKERNREGINKIILKRMTFGVGES